MLWLVSAVSLSITMALCVVGVFIPKTYYDDNLLQRIGMTGVFAFCWPRLMQILDRFELTSATMPVSAQVFGHVGLMLFAVGTAYKVWKHRPNRKKNKGGPPRPTMYHRRITDVSYDDALRVLGRGKAR
jgi:hypothetical protein